MNLVEDKIADFLDACWRAGIKSPIGFLLSKRPQVYDWLKGAFPRGILPTDVDGEVEINGYFLRLEFKHDQALRDGHIPKGQLKALQRLISTKKFTVFIIGMSDLGDPTCIAVYSNMGHTPLFDANKEKIRELCKAWSDKAEAGTLNIEEAA